MASERLTEQQIEHGKAFARAQAGKPYRLQVRDAHDSSERARAERRR